MFNFYNRVDIYFTDGENELHYNYNFDMNDYDDYFTIRTEVILGTINRGWRGNMKFKFSGSNLENMDNAKEDVIFEDVLCINRKFDKDSDGSTMWEYKFSKY